LICSDPISSKNSEQKYQIMTNKEQALTARKLRVNAEKKLKLKQQTNDIPEMESDVKRLLHELQVHQIELEMQNEELHRANQSTEEALKKYTMLYDFAPMGYFTLEPDGMISDMNFTGAEILGDKRINLVNINFGFFVEPDSKTEFNNFMRSVYKSNSKECCELMLVSAEKNTCPVYIEGVVTGDDRKCLLSVINTSGFKTRL